MQPSYLETKNSDKSSDLIDYAQMQFCFPEHSTYFSLRKSLSQGLSASKNDDKKMLLKSFTCECKKHHGMQFYSVVCSSTKNIQIETCKASVIKDAPKITIITKKGHYTLEGYKVFSHHSNWKVRVAVTSGLVRMHSSTALLLLSELLNDVHFGVRLAAIHAIETYGKDGARMLSKSSYDNQYISDIKTRAKKRIKFGIVPKIEQHLNQKISRCSFGNNDSAKHIVTQLYAEGAFRKIFDNRVHQAKLLLPKNVFYSLKNFPYYNLRSPVIDLTQQFVITTKGENFYFETQRRSKITTSHRKRQFLEQLIVKKAFIKTDRIDKVINPQPGEVFWAITYHDDPKPARPVVVVDDETIMPLTSQIQSREKGVIVEIKGEKSKVQIRRLDRLDTSMLIEKFAALKSNEMAEILRKKKLQNAALLQSHVKRPSQNYYKKHKVKLGETNIIIDLDAFRRDALCSGIITKTPRLTSGTDEAKNVARRALAFLSELIGKKPLPPSGKTLMNPKSKDKKKNKKKKKSQKQAIKPQKFSVASEESSDAFSGSTTIFANNTFADSISVAGAASTIRAFSNEPLLVQPRAQSTVSAEELREAERMLAELYESTSSTIASKLSTTTTEQVQSVKVLANSLLVTTQSSFADQLPLISVASSSSINTTSLLPESTSLQCASSGNESKSSTEVVSKNNKNVSLVPKIAKTILCRFFKSGNCKNGKNCPNAHGQSELFKKFEYVKKI